MKEYIRIAFSQTDVIVSIRLARSSSLSEDSASASPDPRISAPHQRQSQQQHKQRQHLSIDSSAQSLKPFGPMGDQEIQN
jgi:hypothetical protein